MINKLSGWDDTIVAVATAPGLGAIAVIRLSGANAIDIANKLFPTKNLLLQSSHTMHVGILMQNNIAIDEVVVSIFKGNKSYTGENVVEISCHGSPFIQQKILQVCVNEGARLARAGEFTQRAFLNGKLDLTQAEAVADLIAANTEASQKTALNNIRGGFSEQLQVMREQLIQFASLIELELDFAEEDVAFADMEKFYVLVQSILTSVQKLIHSFQLGNVIKQGVSVAIIGKPNAGKSTLLNALLNENRAIVSDIAGTTRDTIEELININGIVFRLIDTAGIRSHSTDLIENIGIEKSLEKMRSADIVVYIFDANSESEADLTNQIQLFGRTNTKFLLVGNKSDLNELSYYKDRFSLQVQLLFIAAKAAKGIDELKELIYRSTVDATVSVDQMVITNARHFEALQEIQKNLLAIKGGLDNKLSGDLLAPDIRTCLYYLGEITGEITNEDKLDYIFSKFCIGK